MFYRYCYLGKKNEIIKYKDNRRLDIYSKINLSKEQTQEIDDFYLSNYGQRIPYTWHRYYYAMTGKFDKKYFPELLYIPEYEWFVNSREYEYALSDKNITSLIFRNLDIVKLPKTIISCCKGIFRDTNCIYISREKAKEILSNIGKVFIKPSVDSSSGQGCRVANFYKGYDELTKDTIEDVFYSLGDNFIIQEIISCHDSIKKLHPESVNTFRVISYITSNKEIHHTPIIMRIGQGGNFVDNAHAGGLVIGVSDDGNLLNYATTEFNDKYYVHPTSGIIFEGYKIPLMGKLIEVSKLIHSMIPQIGCINFDFTIDNNGDIVLIETNLRGGSIWLPQIVWGCGAFGDDTEAILQFMREKKKRLFGIIK